MDTMKNPTFKWPKNLTVLLAILGIGLIYFIYLPVSYDFDGTVFSHYLRYGLVKNDLATVKQPQHLLYMPVNYLIYKALNITAGYNALEYFHLQLFSLFFGLLNLWLCYRLIRRFTGRRFFQIAGTVLIAVSYGIWYYSVEAEVHMPGLFFNAAGIYLLFFKPAEGHPLWRREILAAACFALAAGFHLTNGLIAVSASIIFVMEKRRFLEILRFFTFYGVLMAAQLAIFAWASDIDLLGHYRDQLAGSDVLAGYKISYWTPLSPATLWQSFKSIGHGILAPVSPVLGILSTVLLLAAAGLAVYGGVKRGDRKDYYRLAAWMLPYFVFFSFWDHRNPEFKLNALTPLLILFIASAADLTFKKARGPLIIIMILLLGTLNFYYSMLPANRFENNINYQVAEAVGTLTPPGSVIVIGGCGPGVSIYNKIYIPYFALREVFIADWQLGKGLSLEDLGRWVNRTAAAGKAVYFFSEILYDSPTLRQLLKNHKMDAPGYFDFLKQLTLGEPIPLARGYYLRRASSWGSRQRGGSGR
jgi:hypothetical protein